MKLLAFVTLGLVACAPQPPLSAKPSGKCSTVRLAKFIGKPSTVGLANDALKRAGASTARIIGPGEAVTMDYRERRLNIHIDANGRVDHFTCG